MHWCINMNEYSNGRKIWGIIYPPLLYEMITIVVSAIGGAVLGVIYALNNGPENWTGMTNELKDYINQSSMYLLLASAVVAIPVFYSLYRRDNRKIRNSPNATKYGSIEQVKFLYIIPLAVCACTGYNKLISFFAALLPSSFSRSFEQVAESLNTGSTFLKIITVAILVPIIEELVFRGLIFRRLQNMVNRKAAIVSSAFIFGIFHMNLIQGMYAFILGLFLAFLYDKYKNIWAPIIFHMTANGVSLIIQETSLAKYLYNNIYTLMILMILEILITLVIYNLIDKNITAPVLVQELIEKEDS